MQKYLQLLLFSAVWLLSATYALAQSGTVSGKVADANGNPLAGATVRVLNSALGTLTNDQGQYSLTVPAGEVEIQAAMLSYATSVQTASVPANGAASLNFSLAEDVLGLGEIVVTGVANSRSKLESSVSVTSIDSRQLNQVGATNTAELFRTIPGIRSEASAGEGNTNITARGVPISAGGSKYLQLQEDGLPLMMFGDIAFATADIFLRADQNIARVEAIRGGSASTAASNSPAGIINFVSKTGAVSGGSVMSSVGVGYNNFRTDFEVGSPLGNDVSFHIGGFFRQGEGVRTAGYTANYGGQIKANMTKHFEKGYARIYYKFLNDRAAAYMPMPMVVTGTNADPQWASAPGFDALRGTVHSPYFGVGLGFGPDGALRRSYLSDGMHPQSHSVGTEFAFDMGDGWHLENRNRMSFNKGRFLSPFPANFGTAASIFGGVAGANPATATYADNGAAFGTGFGGNNLAMLVHMFDTELNNFNNFMNDFNVSKSLGSVSLKAGVFKAYQQVNMSWLWNSYLTDVNGDGTRLLNIADTNGVSLTDGGLLAYGVPAWGNCCQRNYDVAYDITAPYANVAVELDALSLDASARWDIGRVNGTFAGAVQSTADMNNDGVISAPEKSVSAVDNAHRTVVNYGYKYLSFSAGANYKLNENTAVFGRYSRGGSAKADRILFSGLDYTNSDKLNAKDMIDQAEIGYKARFKNAGLFVTGFYAQTTEEGGFEATTQQIIENDYRALGLELEGSYSIGNFDIRGGATLTKANITSGTDSLNTPRRQAGVIYSLMPTYATNRYSVGLTIYGTTKSYAQNGNSLVMPGYAVINAFARVNVAEGLYIGLNANNLLNAMGVTESEEGSITEGQTNYVRARSIAGRTANLTVGFSF